METAGQYVPGHTFLHRTEARAKLICLIFLTAAVVTASGLTGYAVLLGTACLAVWMAGQSVKEICRQMKKIAGFLLFIFLMNVFFYQGEWILWSWGIFHITKGGIKQGIRVGANVLLVLLFSGALLRTTAPGEITDGLERLLSPLGRLGVPTQEAAMIIGVAVQFIPALGEEAEQIKMAQIARGARFESSSLRERAQSYLPLVIPVFLAAFRRADELSCAMEARGYRGAKQRTKKEGRPLLKKDMALMAGSTALWAAIRALQFL